MIVKFFTVFTGLVLLGACGRPLTVQDETTAAGMSGGWNWRGGNRAGDRTPPPPTTPAPPPAEKADEETPEESVTTTTPPPSPPEPTPAPATNEFSLGQINWSASPRPTLNGRPAPLGILPYWYDYPWVRVTEQNQWTQTLLENLDQLPAFHSIVPQDMERFCPRYPSMNKDERKLFWARYFSVLIEMESTFNPRLVVHDTGVGPNIYSSGLLQLSLRSVQHPPYGCSMIRQQNDLLDPRKNIACGVRVMAHFLRNDQIATGYRESARTWLGGARYWAPLRHDHLRSARGRGMLDSWIQQFRTGWQRAGASDQHPAREDSERRRKGEKKLEKLLRLMNGMPLCHSPIATN